MTIETCPTTLADVTKAFALGQFQPMDASDFEMFAGAEQGSVILHVGGYDEADEDAQHVVIFNPADPKEGFEVIATNGDADMAAWRLFFDGSELRLF